MGFFSNLFGKNKVNYGELYPDPPQLRVDDADIYLKQIDSIINDYEGIRTGDNSFDAIKYLYQPQEALVNREYGIGTTPGDTYGSKAGAMQRLDASLNQRGLLDSGTSGLLESQLESDRIRQLAGLFGDAKQVQRQEYFDALGKLEGLFPQRFEVRNIPNAVQYFNDVNNYNVAGQRNAATTAGRLTRDANQMASIGNLIGVVGSTVGSAFGIPQAGKPLASIFNQAGTNLNNQAMTVGSPTLNQRLLQTPGVGGGGVIQPTASQSSSNVTSSTPGLSGLFKGGSSGTPLDFSKLLKMMMAGGA